MFVEINTDDLPADDRFSRWLETISQTVIPVAVRRVSSDGFRATMRTVDLGGIQASHLTQPSLEVHRTPELIRRSDPEVYHVALNLRGTSTITQEGRDTALTPRDLTLYDSSRPYQSVIRGASGHAAVVVLIPHALLPLSAGQVERLLAVRMTGREGTGALVTRYLLELIEHADECSAADTARLATVTLDLVTVMLAHRLDADRAVPVETRQGALLAQVKAFIHQHLGDPALTPETVAAAHHISTRSLQRLFQSDHLTVAAYIRTRRLERCRRDLSEYPPRAQPVQTIAARWGFTSPAHFSRLFRQTYGVSPQEYRARHDAAPASPQG